LAANGAVGVITWTTFSRRHPDLTALRDKSFVTVKINFSEENPNKEVLAQYPPSRAIRTCSCWIPTER
jgi:hypothetical protein